MIVLKDGRSPSRVVSQTIASTLFLYSGIWYDGFSPCSPAPALFFRTELDSYLLCLCSLVLIVHFGSMNVLFPETAFYHYFILKGKKTLVKTLLSANTHGENRSAVCLVLNLTYRYLLCPRRYKGIRVISCMLATGGLEQLRLWIKDDF